MAEAVVFDIGNVLITWNPDQLYRELVPDAAARAALFQRIDLHAMNDRIDRGANWRATVEATAAEHPDIAHLITPWHDRWLDMAKPVIPRSWRLLRALRAKGVPVFALSNFGKETFAYAETVYPELSEFDARFISGHMGVIKPEPRIYEMVEEATALTGPALIFTDDRADNVAAAKARGWKAHLFDGPEGWAARLVAEGLLTEAEAA